MKFSTTVLVIVALVLGEAVVTSASAQNWMVRADLPTARSDFAVATGQGTDGKTRIYVFGGDGGPQAPGPAAIVEAYSPNTWLSSTVGDLSPMPTPRADMAAVTVSGKLMLIGGRTGPNATALVEVYDPASDQWTSWNPLPNPRTDLAAAVVGNQVLVFGGSSSSGIPTNDVYIASFPGSWATPTGVALPIPLINHAVAVKSGKVYVVGGNTTGGGHNLKSWIFDPASQTFASGPDLPEPMTDHVAVVGSNGVLYVMGTRNYITGDPFAYRLDQSSQSWVAINPMPKGGRLGAGASRLGHFVHVIGGAYKMENYGADNQAFCAASRRQCMMAMISQFEAAPASTSLSRPIKTKPGEGPGKVEGATPVTIAGRVVRTEAGIMVSVGGASVPGRVSGRGVPGVEIAIESLSSRDGSRTRSDREGIFRFTVQPGQYQITAMVGQRPYRAQVTIPSGAPMPAVVITENGVSQ